MLLTKQEMELIKSGNTGLLFVCKQYMNKPDIVEQIISEVNNDIDEETSTGN